MARRFARTALLHLAVIVAAAAATMLLAVAGPAAAAFPGQNGKIAFDGNYEVYVMNADGSGQQNLTRSPGVDVNPAFSPDGSKIAFASYRDGNYEIYVMNADGSDQRRLTGVPGFDLYPAFSPDGSKIAFASTRDVNSEIYVMNADGSGQANLSRAAGEDSEPSWQPLQAPRPAPACTVPKLKGKQLKRARKLLTAAHCSAVKVNRSKHGAHGRRAVVRKQSPAPGTRIPSTSRVTLKLASHG
jgi:dipeptidyl aminopeptidase/acylaminoacyl peptidase